LPEIVGNDTGSTIQGDFVFCDEMTD
jgi:hypothetical protein